MKLPSSVYSALAVLLPVALGLGLIYLYVMGRIDGEAVAFTIAAMLAVIPLAELLRRLADEPLRRTYAGRRSPRGWSR